MKYFFIILFSVLIAPSFKEQEKPYKEIIEDSSYKILNIDINKDDIKDKVAYNTAGNDLLFYVKKENTYRNVLHGDNYTMDGIYFINQIKGFDEGNHVLYIQNIFNGAGGQTREYFLSYVNKKWIAEESITTFSDDSETKTCKDFDKKERCITIENKSDFITNVAEAAHTKKNSDFIQKNIYFLY